MYQEAYHVAADASHAPVPESGYNDEISDNCAVCGLATTADGKHHGYDSEDAVPR